MKTLKMRNGDVVVDGAGQLSFLEGTAKASQSLARILRLDAPYGAGIYAQLGKASDPAAVVLNTQRNIRQAFRNYVALQKRQRDLTSAETLVALTQVTVTPTYRDGRPTKTGYAFQVRAITAERQTAASNVDLVG